MSPPATAPDAAPEEGGAAPPREMRSDARRNRARLIEAAAEAFRDQGLEVGVDEIARRAGVGVGTLYRHFPTKRDLIVAILAGMFEWIERAGREAAESPGEGPILGPFLERVMARMSAERALAETIGRHHPEPAQEVRNRLRRDLVASFTPLIERAHATGELDPELDAEDLMVAIRMLSAATRGDLARDPRRYLALLLAGLRAGPVGDR